MKIYITYASEIEINSFLFLAEVLPRWVRSIQCFFNTWTWIVSLQITLQMITIRAMLKHRYQSMFLLHLDLETLYPEPGTGSSSLPILRTHRAKGFFLGSLLRWPPTVLALPMQQTHIAMNKYFISLLSWKWNRNDKIRIWLLKTPQS